VILTRPFDLRRPAAHTPTLLIYRPPEARFASASRPLSFPADIWGLAGIIWEVVGQHTLLPLLWDDNGALDDLVDLLGKPPDEWWVQ